MTDSLGTVRAELALKTIYYLIAADGDEILDRIDEENIGWSAADDGRIVYLIGKKVYSFDARHLGKVLEVDGRRARVLGPSGVEGTYTLTLPSLNYWSRSTEARFQPGQGPSRAARSDHQ